MIARLEKKVKYLPKMKKCFGQWIALSEIHQSKDNSNNHGRVMRYQVIQCSMRSRIAKKRMGMGRNKQLGDIYDHRSERIGNTR